jgi:hypothetical protein
MVLNPSHGRHNGPGSDVQLREGRRSPYAACLGPGNHREASYKAYPCRLDDSTHKASGQVGALAPACTVLCARLRPSLTVALSLTRESGLAHLVDRPKGCGSGLVPDVAREPAALGLDASR